MSFVKLPLCCLSRNLHTCQVVSRLLIRRPCLPSQTNYSKWTRLKHKMKKNQRLKVKQMIDIRANMKVKDLARQMQMPIDEMLESLEETVGEEIYKTEDDKIENLALLKQIVRKHELNFKLMQPERKTNKETEFGAVHVPQRKTKEPDKVNVDKEMEILQEAVKTEESPDPARLSPRTPIVTIMGHVDHGKTTLLDALRESSIVDQEFGGITQHIGAFMVKMATGETITFLDTPGHAAFSSMRSRGAMVTDIVVLVVAADDSVMNQTVESIQHAREAKVPIIVAINKIDKHGADVERTKQKLAEYGVVVEEYGGDVQTVPISALKRINLDLLQECITTQAEVLDLKADRQAKVCGTVIESKTELGRGKMATVIIKNGTLRVGDVIMAGRTWAKVRAMHNEHGQDVEEALPGMPVEVTGWKDLPSAGDPFLQASTEREAKTVLAGRMLQHREQEMDTIIEKIDKQRQVDYEEYRALKDEKEQLLQSRARYFSLKRYLARTKGIFDNHIELNKRTIPSFPIIVKCDVDGSLDAIMEILGKFQSNMCTLDIMDMGVGDVTEYDLQLAQTFGGHIYAFNVNVLQDAQTAESKTTIKHFNIIYKMMDDLVESMSDLLPPKVSEKVLGEATVMKEFTINWKRKKIPIGGCRCTKGILESDKNYKVIRDDKVVYTGPLLSLRHHKTEVKLIKSGMECGLCLDPEAGVKVEVDDHIVCYDHIEERQKLDWTPDFI